MAVHKECEHPTGKQDAEGHGEEEQLDARCGESKHQHRPHQSHEVEASARHPLLGFHFRRRKRPWVGLDKGLV